MIPSFKESNSPSTAFILQMHLLQQQHHHPSLNTPLFIRRHASSRRRNMQHLQQSLLSRAALAYL
jgi:hypothetical protein